jgi:hypothetical protein
MSFFIIYLLLFVRSLSELTMEWNRIPPLVRFSLQQAIQHRAGQFDERELSMLLLRSVSVHYVLSFSLSLCQFCK